MFKYDLQPTLRTLVEDLQVARMLGDALSVLIMRSGEPQVVITKGDLEEILASNKVIDLTSTKDTLIFTVEDIPAKADPIAQPESVA